MLKLHPRAVPDLASKPARKQVAIVHPSADRRMEPEIPIDRFEVFANGLDHPECVAFDREGMLWAGGEAGQVYCVDRKGTVETIATLGGFTGGLAFSPDNELFLCNPSLGIVRVRRDGKHD